MIGDPLHAAVMFVLLLYVVTVFGNAFRGTCRSLVQAEAIREDNLRTARRLRSDGEAFRVRQRQRKEGLDSRERFLDEFQRSVDARQDIVAAREQKMAGLEAREKHFDMMFQRYRDFRDRQALLIETWYELDDDADVPHMPTSRYCTVQVKVNADLLGALGDGCGHGYEAYVADRFARALESTIKETGWGRTSPDNQHLDARGLRPDGYYPTWGMSAEQRFEHWTSPLTSVDPAVASEQMASYLLSGDTLKERPYAMDWRQWFIPYPDLIIKPPRGSEPKGSIALEPAKLYPPHGAKLV